VVIVSKGMSAEEDKQSYSAFGGKVDIDETTVIAGIAGRTLEDVLRAFKAKTLFIGGLATDYCVKATVLDALKLGFEVYLLKDACRAVNVKPDDGKRTIAEMKKAGMKITTTKEVLGK
ncbi:MAG: isochorismatase family protein, partial [bacterium]|nr:isochorismatase family protein [bacterium]